MLELSYLQCRCHFILALVFISTCPVKILTLTNSTSHALLSVESSSSLASSGLHSVLSLSVDGSSSATASQTLESLNSLVTSSLDPSRIGEQSSWSLYNGSTGTVQLGKTISSERTSHERNVHGTTKSTLAHAQSIVVSSTPMVGQPSSSGIITSPIVSSKSRRSSLDNWQSRSTAVTSSFELVPALTKNEQSSRRKSLDTQTTMISQSDVKSSKMLAQTGIYSKYISSSTLEILPGEQLGKTAARSNGSSNMSSLKMVHSSTIHHNNETPRSVSVSSYGHSTSDTSFSNTLIRETVATTRLSDFDTTVGKDSNSQTNNGTTLLIGFTSTSSSLKVQIISSIQPSIKRLALSTKSAQLVPSPTLTATYNANASLIHATGSPQNSNIQQNSNTAKISESSLSQPIPSYSPRETHVENTVNASRSHSLSSLYQSSNAYHVVTSALSSIPFVSSSPLDSLKHNNASTKSTQPAMLGTSWTERVMNNSYLSSAKMNILSTFVASKTTETKNKEYTLQTIESQNQSYRVKTSTPGFVVNSTPLPEMSRTHEASVVSDSVPPFVSQTSYSWPTSSSLVNQSASPSLIKTIVSPTRNKSSIAISKESSHVVMHRSVISSGTLMSPSHHISDTFISSVVPILPTASPSAVMSSSLLATSPSLVDRSHGLTSTAFHPDLSKMSSSEISSSKMVGYSVVPIMKPCYISYVITITQRLGLSSNSSGPILHNISSSRFENRSTNFILHPSPSTTATDPQINTESLSISKDRIHTKSAFPSQSHIETDVTSSDFHSLTKKSSRYTLEVAVSYNASNNPSTSAVETATQFPTATLSVIKQLSETRPQYNTRYQSSLTTVEPTPYVINQSLSRSFAMKPSLEPLQTTGHLSTAVEGYSHQLASSHFATNSNKINATASVFEVSSRDRTRHPRSIALSVTSSPTWTNFSSFIRKTSLIEDIVSTQSAKFVNLSTTGIQSTPSLLNASLTTAHHNEETSTSILPSIPKMSAVATNMTFLKTTRHPIQTRTSSAIIRDRSTAYANENSSPTSVPMVNFATPVLSNISVSVPSQIPLDGGTSTISSLPTMLVNSTLPEPTMFSLSKSIGRSSAPGTGTSISVHSASHNLSSSEVKNLQRSPVTTIYPTPTTAGNRSTTSTSLWSETVALQSVSAKNFSPKSTESLSALWIGKPTSVQLSSNNFSSTELGISQRSPVTITISPSPAIHNNTSTINEPLESLSSETVAPQSVSSQKSPGIDTTILEDYQRKQSSTLLNLALSTIFSSPYPGSITSRIPTDDSSSVNSNLSMSKMTIHPVGQTASMISSIDFTSSPEAFPDATSIYHLSSSSVNIQASQSHSNIISPSPSQTTSPNTTAPARRKRRNIENVQTLSTNSNSSAVRSIPTIIEPTKSSLIPSAVLATSTRNPRLSSTSKHRKTNVNSSEFLKPSSATVGSEVLSISLIMTPSLTKSPSVLTTVYPSKNVSPISPMLKNASYVMSSKSNLQSSTDALQGIEKASQTVSVVSNSSGSYSTTFSKFDQAPSTITWYPVASSGNMLNSTATVIQKVLVTSHTSSTNHILSLTTDKSSPIVLQTTRSLSTNSQYSLDTMANPPGSISTFSLHTFQSRINTKDIPNATSLSFATQIPRKSSKTNMPIFSSLGVAVSSAVISPSYNRPSSLVNISRATISPYHFSSSEDSSDHLANRTVISKSYLPISESRLLRNSSQTSPLSSTAHENQPPSTNSISIITPVVVHTVKNSSKRESSTQTSFQVIATAHFSTVSQKVTRVSRSPAEERELKPTPSLSYVLSYVISQKRNSSQHTARNSSIRESLTQTSFQVVAAANFSTVSQKISAVSRSPADKEEIRPTLSSSYVSSTVISQNRNSSQTPSSSGKLLFSEFTKHQTKVISLNIYSTARLSPSSPMATISAAKTATTKTKRPTVPLFTYYLIPTSSLGSCLVGYSTIYLSNVTGELLTTTTAATPRNTSALSPSPVLFTGTSQSSAINASAGSPSPVLFTKTSQSSAINASAGSPSPVVFTWTSSASSFVVNITSRPMMSLHLNPSSSATFQTESSGIDQMNNSTIVKSFLYSTQNVDASKSFYGSTTIHPRRRTLFSNPTVVASPTSYRASVSSIPTPSVQTAPRSVIATSSVSPNVKTSVFTIPLSPSLSSSYSSISPSSSVITTSPTINENSLLLIVLSVPLEVNIRTNQFKEDMEETLKDVYQKGQLVQKSRRKRNARLDTSVKVQNVRRDRERVNVEYIVIDNSKTMPAADAAKTMNVLSVETLGSTIGYKVLVRPEPAPKEFTTDNIVAMLIETNSQSNISTSLVKKSFENELANFYINSGKGARVQNVSALITHTYFEPLQRTYIEFAIIVDQATVNQSLILQVFNVRKSELTSNLKQTVLVGPYIPGLINPTAQDYIIQGMEYDGGNSEEAKKQLSTKLSKVYLAAKQKGSRKRRKRALGSIDSVITYITPATKDSKVDVTYYITDGGSILNATYASSILNRLSIKEMSSITTPYVVTTSPRSTLPSTSKMSDDDGYPSWMIPVIAACSVGFLLFIIIIILYCRWKKGAPSKKVQPEVTSATEEQREGPRITHAADPEVRRDLGRHLPPMPTAVSTEGNNARSSVRPPVRKPPVRENSVRRKVSSRESLITSQMTRTNPAFVGESGDESDGVTQGSVAQNGRRQIKAQVVAKKEIVEPRKRPPSPVLQETLESEEESETEASDGDSVYTKDSVFTGNTDQHSPAALPRLAVMSETRQPVQQPPVRFRTSVHPEASLPPIDIKQTSLISRVVEEEGPLQHEISKKADIERWRNKQRQREKKLGESQSKPGKRPSFTEKKAWNRAQQEIGSVLDPDAMQPIVRKKKRKPRRKYNMMTETTDDENNVQLRGFQKLGSPREEKKAQREQDSQSDSDISMGEARRRMISLLDDAFASMKSRSKNHSADGTDQPDGKTDSKQPQGYPPSGYRPPLHPRPAVSAPALPEPPPAHGRATAPSARHRRRFLNSQNSLPYPSHYYPGSNGRAPYPPPQPVFTKNPVVVWDPADKQRLLNQSSYRPYPGHPYTYSDPSGRLHFTPVQHTPDGMGGLVWSPYATEYAMEDFYRNVRMPETLDAKNATFFSEMQETPLAAVPEGTAVPRDTVIDMGGSGITSETGSMTGQSAEPLVRAIKDELFRLSNGRTPVKHL